MTRAAHPGRLLPPPVRRRRLGALLAAGALIAAAALVSSLPSAGAAAKPHAAARFAAGVCNPRPCSPGPLQSFAIRTTDASSPPFGTARRPAAVTTTINIERPANLATASAAPAVIVTCTPATNAADWQAAAAADGFVYVKYDSIAGPGMPTGCDYQAPADAWRVTAGSHAQLHDCGVSGADWCDSIPGLVSTIHAIECSGSPPCENVNPREVYVVGGSEAGLFTEGAMCDTRSSRLIAGVQVLSDLLVSPGRRNAARAASRVNALPPNCPALLGRGRDCHADCARAHRNVKLAIQWVWGSADAAFSGAATSCAPDRNCVGTGLYFTASPDYWFWGDIDLARGLIGHGALGCSSTPASVATGGYSGKIVISTYTGCRDPGAAVQTVQVNGGGHLPDTWPIGQGSTSCQSPGTTCLSNSDGLSDPAVAWAFWSAHRP